ncbi:MAG: hypothetical protein JW840_06100 [Candidatus Thermoplasmatota archaeon]|nr:hypothetical protein [Candidatus Thermoplasmatota archaeon]
MRKTLIGGSLLAVFLLLMLPTVAAEEVKVAQSAPTSPNLLDLQTAYLEELREKFKDGPHPQIILITLAILLLKFLRWGVIIFGGIILLIILRILRKNNSTAVF